MLAARTTMAKGWTNEENGDTLHIKKIKKKKRKKHMKKRVGTPISR